MQDQKLLTLHSCSFSRWDSEHFAVSSFYKGGQYFVYECVQPVSPQITQDTWPTIIDTLLTFIFRMMSGACLCSFWFLRRPIHQNQQWCTNVNILQLPVAYLNATMNSETWNTELESGTNRSNRRWQNPKVDGNGSLFGAPRASGAGFWMGL